MQAQYKQQEITLPFSLPVNGGKISSPLVGEGWGKGGIPPGDSSILLVPWN